MGDPLAQPGRGAPRAETRRDLCGVRGGERRLRRRAAGAGGGDAATDTRGWITAARRGARRRRAIVRLGRPAWDWEVADHHEHDRPRPRERENRPVRRREAGCPAGRQASPGTGGAWATSLWTCMDAVSAPAEIRAQLKRRSTTSPHTTSEAGRPYARRLRSRYAPLEEYPGGCAAQRTATSRSGGHTKTCSSTAKEQAGVDPGELRRRRPRPGGRDTRRAARLRARGTYRRPGAGAPVGARRRGRPSSSTPARSAARLRSSRAPACC